MLILSLDSAYSYQNFTLYESSEKKLLLHYGEDRGKKSLELFPKIFEDLKVDINKIDLFAVNVGPGYSTSLRVGITLFKTYAQVLNKPLITYNCYEVISLYLQKEGLFLIPLKVSRYWVYALVKVEGNKATFLETAKILEPQKVEEIKNHFGSFELILPSKFQKDLDSLKKLVGDAPIRVLPVEGFSLGGIFVALQKWERGEIPNLLKVEPLYFRPPV